MSDAENSDDFNDFIVEETSIYDDYYKLFHPDSDDFSIEIKHRIKL